MEAITQVGNNMVKITNPAIITIEEMCKEHFLSKADHLDLGINTWLPRSNNKRVHYNLEHKYPLTDGKPACCSWTWENQYRNELMVDHDEVWDFNIENYPYWESIGLGDKFVFVPYRYCSYFDRFPAKLPRYDLEFEGVFDSRMRLYYIQTLTHLCSSNGLSIKIANTVDPMVKCDEKLDAKYNLDLPHYDTPETINATRIYESICLNKQTIVIDPYHCGSRKYFDDLVIYLDDVTVLLLKIINQEPRTDIAQKFKEMTYTDEAYEQYRRSIKEDFERISGIRIPDSVLRKIC